MSVWFFSVWFLCSLFEAEIKAAEKETKAQKKQLKAAKEELKQAEAAKKEAAEATSVLEVRQSSYPIAQKD